MTDDGVPAAMVNLRDLGGLPVLGGGVTRSGILWRGDVPLASDLSSIRHGWPPATVCDLRSPRERTTPHPLAVAGTSVLAVPLTDHADPNRLISEGGGTGLAGVYERIVRERRGGLVEVVEAVAGRPGPFLVHCTAGKDRTGVAVACLLAAVGVEPEAILADYGRTDAVAGPLYERLEQAHPPAERAAFRQVVRTADPALLGTSREAMSGVIEHWEAHPGGAAQWLLDQGLDPASLERVREVLIGPGGWDDTR